MNTNPTSTGRTPPNQGSASFTLRTASCGSTRPGSPGELGAFEIDWPGSRRWGVNVSRRVIRWRPEQDSNL